MSEDHGMELLRLLDEIHAHTAGAVLADGSYTDINAGIFLDNEGDIKEHVAGLVAELASEREARKKAEAALVTAKHDTAETLAALIRAESVISRSAEVEGAAIGRADMAQHGMYLAVVQRDQAIARAERAEAALARRTIERDRAREWVLFAASCGDWLNSPIDALADEPEEQT
jgi:hypothetical protein